MNGILNYIASHDATARYSAFRPASVQEFFALRLAQKLKEERSAAHYIELLDRYTEDECLAAFAAVKDRPAADRARLFHRTLELRNARRRYGRTSTGDRLAAIRVERRSVAIVILTAGHPEHMQVRQLSSSSEKALGSAYGFVNRTLEMFHPQSAVLERMTAALDIQRAHVTAAIVGLLRERGVGVWEFSKRELFLGFGVPPLRSRLELRDVIGSIWPMLNGGYGGPFVRDAAALGLFCHAERQFNS